MAKRKSNKTFDTELFNNRRTSGIWKVTRPPWTSSGPDEWYCFSYMDKNNNKKLFIFPFISGFVKDTKWEGIIGYTYSTYNEEDVINRGLEYIDGPYPPRKFTPFFNQYIKKYHKQI